MVRFWFPLIACLWVFAAQADVPLDEIVAYEADDHDRTPTLCDELAAHPRDPGKVTGGVSRADMDIPGAIEACTAAIEADPGNPRLNYQLARAYSYAGRSPEGAVYRDTAVRAGYPQSLFVVGYIRIEGWDGREPDPCYGGELVRRSAEVGRLAGLIGFAHYVSMGTFEGCEAYPVIDVEEINAFLDEAEARDIDYYQGLLVEQLRMHFAD